MIKNFEGCDFVEGETLLINKPLKWSSFDLVKKVRSQLKHKLDLKKIKVGHAGTLDPLATGVMIICTGRSTKTIDQLQAKEKEYIATVKLGATTPSFDLETEEDAQFEYKHITKELLFEKTQEFIGEIRQVPPVYSALKVNGKRAYSFARKGQTVELKAKTLVIEEIEIVDFQLPIVKLRIVCSKGTYIRALARDIGEALNSGAYLTGLLRTRVGDYLLEDTIEIDDFENMLKNTQLMEN
jgi:tRNA pseudouridine55 synthase